MKMMVVSLSPLWFLAAGFPLHAQEGAPPPTPVPTADTQSNANPPAPSLPVPAAGDPLYAPVTTSPQPESLQEKFMNYAIVTFGPRVLFTPAIGAAIRMARPGTDTHAIGASGRARLDGTTGLPSPTGRPWKPAGS